MTKHPLSSSLLLALATSVACSTPSDTDDCGSTSRTLEECASSLFVHYDRPVAGDYDAVFEVDGEQVLIDCSPKPPSEATVVHSAELDGHTVSVLCFDDGIELTGLHPDELRFSLETADASARANVHLEPAYVEHPQTCSESCFNATVDIALDGGPS